MIDPALVAVWVVRVLLAGGGVLLATASVVRLLRQPAHRQRVAELGAFASLLVAALCLAPSWLNLPLLRPEAGPPAAVASPAPEHPAAPQDFGEMLGALPEANEEIIAQEEPSLRQEATPPLPSTESLSPTSHVSFEPLLLTLYLAGAGYFLLRFLWGHVQLHRLVSTARPAPARVRLLFSTLTSHRRPRLLVSDRVAVPISFGLLRPTVVLPEVVCDDFDEESLRWLLSHELTHLRRRDALTSMLLGLARVLFYVLPWYWWLRRQVRLCQEYVADAAAGQGEPERYAEFLLHWTAAPVVPAGATGVSGHTSDLFRRITMLVQRPMKIEERCPRRWSLLAAGALLSLALVAGGIGLSHARSADDTKKEKDATKAPANKDEPKKEEKKPEKKNDLLPGFPDVDDLFKGLPGGLDDETAKMIRQQLEMTRKLMEQLQKQVPGAGLPQLPGGGLVPFPQLPNLNRLPRTRGGMVPEGRLGAYVDKPSAALADQLDLPKNQGLVIQELRDDSAAAKAGLKQHDILLELNGKAVPSDPAEFSKVLKEIKPDQAVDAVVMRKTRKETIKGLKLPAAAEQPQRGRNPFRLQINPGVGGLNTTITRTNDAFTAKHSADGVAFTVVGKIEDGKAKATEITINDGKDQTYDTLDKVPEQYRDKVRQLMQMAEGGRARTNRLRL
jgi:beta-lactamase regulating signal transducer with metallopeptidase domain